MTQQEIADSNGAGKACLLTYEDKQVASTMTKPGIYASNSFIRLPGLITGMAGKWILVFAMRQIGRWRVIRRLPGKVKYSPDNAEGFIMHHGATSVPLKGFIS